MAQFIDPEGLFHPQPVGFRQVVKVGNLAFLSGQTAQAEDGSLVGVGDPLAQSKRIMQNLNACLKALGVSYHNVIKTTFYYTDRDNMQTFRDVRRKYWPDQSYASTSVMVAGLNNPGFLFEMEAVIELPS